MWENIFPGIRESDVLPLPVAAVAAQNRPASDAVVALAELQLEAALLASKFGSSRLAERVTITADLLQRLTEAAAADEARAETLSRLRKELSDACKSLDEERKSSERREELMAQKIGDQEKQIEDFKSSTESSSAKIADLEAELKKLRDTAIAQDAELSKMTKRLSVWKQRAESYPEAFVEFVRLECSVDDPGGVLELLLTHFPEKKALEVPDEVRITIKRVPRCDAARTSEGPTPAAAAALGNRGCCAGGEGSDMRPPSYADFDAEGSAAGTPGAGVNKRVRADSSGSEGSNGDGADEAVSTRLRKKPRAAGGLDEFTLPDGTRFWLHNPPLDTPDLPTGVESFEEIPRDVFELLRRGFAYQTAQDLVSSGAPIHQYFSADQLSGLAIWVLRESDRGDEHSWLVHAPREVVEGARREIALQDKEDAAEGESVYSPNQSDDDSVDSDAPGDSELVAAIPISELLKPEIPVSASKRRARSGSEASGASPASSKSRAADILPVIKATVSESVGGIKLTLSDNYAGFPNLALPKRACKEMCSRLNLDEYEALLNAKPWDEMFENRAKALVLLKRSEISESTSKAITEAVDFMSAHRRALWERQHWLSLPQYLNSDGAPVTSSEYTKLDKAAQGKLRVVDGYASRKMRAAALKSAWIELVHGFTERGGVPDMFWYEPGIWIQARNTCAWNLVRGKPLREQLREFDARYPRCTGWKSWNLKAWRDTLPPGLTMLTTAEIAAQPHRNAIVIPAGDDAE